jgi:hypothetical protein
MPIVAHHAERLAGDGAVLADGTSVFSLIAIRWSISRLRDRLIFSSGRS